MSIARFRTITDTTRRPERWDYPGLGIVIIDVVTDGLGRSYYRGAIHWDGAPKNLYEFVALDDDHDAVQTACETRVKQGPGRHGKR